MKKIVFYLCILVNMGGVGAQSLASFDLLFSEYQSGTAILKDGTNVSGQYNYSTVNRQIQYLDDRGGVMTFQNPQEISVVDIAGRVFENTSGKVFLERISVGEGWYYVEWGAKWVSEGKAAGFGYRSRTASVNSYSVSSSESAFGSPYDSHIQTPSAVDVSGSINGMRIMYKEGMQIVPEYAYFLKIKGKFKRFNSANSLARALGCCKKEIQAFVKKENINFKNPEDVHRMMLALIVK